MCASRAVLVVSAPAACRIVYLAILYLAAAPDTVGATGRRREIVQNKLALSNNEFAFDLYKRIGESVSGRNVFISPASISTALAMVHLGARGKTKAQMATAMHLNTYDLHTTALEEDFKRLLQTLQDSTRNNYTLYVANRLFGQKGYNFKEDFLRDTGDYYNATLEALDFKSDPTAARQHINDWVAEKTSQKITDLLPDDSITEITRLVLVNAIYFKGLWLNKFDKKYTKSDTFHLSNHKQTSIEMMNLGDTSLMYYNSSDLHCEVVELPYVGERVSMLILLPHEVEGLSAAESRLDVESLRKVLGSLRSSLVRVSFPKFAIDQSVALKQFLQMIGIVDLFSGRADLSGIDGTKNLLVTEAMHKAFVEVNEEGTEAAGSTGIEMGVKSSSRWIQFNANRPFLFLIVEKTSGSILFLGRFTQPPRESEKNDIGIFGETGELRCCSGSGNSSSSSTSFTVQPSLHLTQFWITVIFIHLSLFLCHV